MCLTSATASPNAHSPEATRGISTVRIPSSAASRPACAEVAPPPATMLKSRGSWPRSTDTDRIPPIMFPFTMSKMPSAARSGLSPSGSATLVLQCGSRRRGVDRHATAEKRRLVQIAEHDEGVGHGGLRSASHVAGRARDRLGALRPDVEQSLRVDPGDRTAAGADADHVHERHADAVAVDVDVLDEIHLAVLDQRDVAARAADVDAHEVASGRGSRRSAALALGPAAGPELRALTARRENTRPGGESAVRLEVTDRVRVAELGQHPFDRPDVAREAGGDVRVHRDGAGARVLTDLRQQIDRQRHVDVREFLAKDLADATLVIGMEKRPEEGDTDRLVRLPAGTTRSRGRRPPRRAGDVRSRRSARVR